MKFWVIKSNGGLYYYECLDSYYSGFGHLDGNITLYNSKDDANKTIELYELENCKPIMLTITEGDAEQQLAIIEKALELACRYISA